MSYFGLLQPPPSSWMARKIQNYPILPGIILEDDVFLVIKEAGRMKFLSSDCFTACLVVLYKGLIIPSCRRIRRSLSKDLYSPTTNRMECHQDVGHFACCTGLEEERVFLLLVYGCMILGGTSLEHDFGSVRVKLIVCCLPVAIQHQGEFIVIVFFSKPVR